MTPETAQRTDRRRARLKDAAHELQFNEVLQGTTQFEPWT
jgi:hypothetical protein